MAATRISLTSSRHLYTGLNINICNLDRAVFSASLQQIRGYRDWHDRNVIGEPRGQHGIRKGRAWGKSPFRDSKEWDYWDPAIDVQKLVPWKTLHGERYTNSIKYQRKMFGRFGKSSGVDPCLLWPSRRELKELMSQASSERPVDEVKAEVDERKIIANEEKAKRERIIAENMAKMPALIARWEKKVDQDKAKQLEAKETREKMLKEARRTYGQRLREDNPQFKELLAELQKEEEKKDKELRKRGIILPDK